MNSVKWISKAIENRKWMVLVLSLIQSLMALDGVVFALLMRAAIDSAVAGKAFGFQRAALGLVILIMIQIGLRALNNFLAEDTKASVENCLRRKSFRGILQKDYRRITGYHTGELMNRLTSDTLVVANGVVTLLPSLISMIIRILGVLVVMYTIESWFTLIFFIGGCLMAICSLLPRGWLKSLHKQVQESDGNVRCLLQECLESLLVIHTFGCEEKMEKNSIQKMKEHRRIRRKKANVSNIFSVGLNFVVQCGYLLGFIWCGFGILHGRISYGTLTAVIQLIGQIQAPFAGIGNIFPQFSSMLASAERLMDLTVGENADRKKSDMTREAVYAQMEKICFEQVSFRYDADRPVLKDDTFFVRKGEFAALIGTSGIGKSTIMKLLLSVYEPDGGQIYLQCSDKKMPVSELPAGMFAYVPQGNHLMSGTISEVVGFAEHSEKISMEKVVYSCQTACAHDFIMELPMRYDTLLGEKGAGLSEGQMQRLAVARAIYSGCPILLLDEATSALDASTERRLISSLKNLSDRTVFLVTHRKEVWELCDRVLKREELVEDEASGGTE